MEISSFVRGMAIAAVVVSLAGCATKSASFHSGKTLREATGAPDHFMTVTANGNVEPQPGELCRNPLIDPRDQTRLTLVRSHEGRGDYEPAPLRYGVAEGELLRVDCATGRALGIVKR